MAGCFLGTAAQLQQPVLWLTWHYGAALLLALAGTALAVWGAGRHRVAAALLAGGLLGFGLAGLRAEARLADALDPALEGQDLVLTGVIAHMPQPSAIGVGFVFEPEAALHDGRHVKVPSRLSLGWYRGWHNEPQGPDPWAELRAGQRWQFAVRLKQPHGSRNPGGHDHELALFEQGIGAVGTVRTRSQKPVQLPDPGAHPIERARQWVRDAVFRHVADARTAGVLAALVVGDQRAIDRDDWELFRATGVAHLMSISGLHVTMFAWLAAGATGWAWRRSSRAMLWCPAPLAARWWGVAAALGYALLAGWGVPAQRTVWMLATAALLRSSGVRWPWPWVLLAAGTVVVLADPWALLQPGFWLSFVAVGLLMGSEPAHRRVDGDVPVSTMQRMRAALVSMLRTQAVATLGLAPLTLVFFQQLSVVGFAANLVAIPVVTLVVVPLTMLGVLLSPLWPIAAAVVQGLGELLALLARLPIAVWTTGAAAAWAQLIGLLGGVLLLVPLPWRLRALGLPLMLPLLWPAPPVPPEGRFELLAADVGQGGAVLLRTANHLMLYDAGPQYSPETDAGQRVLLPLLRHRGERPIDLLVLSHRDLDHTGGAAALLKQWPVKGMRSSLEPGHPLLSPSVPHQPCVDGQAWQWDGVHFEVLYPPAALLQAAHAQGAKANTISCVLRVQDAAGRSVLLTGDIEAAQERALVAVHGEALRSDVLLAPHHGSRTSSTPQLLQAVAPHTAVVQAGYRNRFNHPAPTIVQRYEDHGIALVRTDRCGAWRWDGEHGQCERERRRRYWQRH